MTASVTHPDQTRVAPYQGFGSSSLRSEDLRLLQGTGSFTDDVDVPGVLHAAFVRSPYAHARIVSIDTTAAQELAGVVAVVTGEDLARWTEPGVIGKPGAPRMVMEAIPTTKVRFNGDLVACVVATDRYVAEDAVALVDVEYEPLEPLIDRQRCLAPDAALVDDALESNLHTAERKTFGDVDAAFAQADRVVEAEFQTQRMTHVPIEPRGIVAVWDAGRRQLTVHSGQQTAHIYRTHLAARLRLQENQVRLVCNDIGGAFGQKIPVYREEVVISALAMQLRRPVKWIEDRLENLMAANHARDDGLRVQAAVTEDGRILGMKAQLWADYGAYAYFSPSYPIDSIGWLLPGPYKFGAYEYTIEVHLSNKCPAGTLRAPMALVTWATEGIIERIAETLGIEPLEIRRRNMITLTDQPYVSASGYTYEALTCLETYEDMYRWFDMTAFRDRQLDARQQGRLLGVGVASVLEPTTYGSAWYKAAGSRGSGHEAATVRVDPTGTVNVMVGVVPSGQGYETTIAQVVAEALGCAPEMVSVRLGDTDLVPYGMGSRGSRGAAAGNAVAYLAAMELRAKIDRLLEDLLGCPATELTVRGGNVFVGDEDAPRATLAEVAWTAYMDPASLPLGELPGLEVHRTYDPPAMTFSNATHLCVVEVDEATGFAQVQEYRVIEDAGTLINPMIVDGQIRGGVSLGIGQALLEEVVYDEDGVNQTSTFVDYLVPTSPTCPPIDIRHVQTPNPNTVRGLKGMAEGPVQGGLAAVMLAVQDAVRCRGVRVKRSPASPTNLRRLLRDGAKVSVDGGRS